MLLELSIQNFAIIPKLHLRFQEGMTALTGETGAGKSIIIDAMSLLAGARGSSEFIRQGADKSVIEGIFELPIQPEFLDLAQELGLDLEEGILIIQRDLTRTGKSFCRVNGRTMTLANLKRIGNFLVDIQGQNDHQQLLQAEKHLSFVDALGTETFKAQLQHYQQEFITYQELDKKVQQIRNNEQLYVQRLDMLKFQKEEIEQAALLPGEEDLLVEERDKLLNFQKIMDAFAKSRAVLSLEEPNLMDTLSLVIGEIQEIAHLSTDYEQLNEQLQSAYYLLQDASDGIAKQVDALELDEERLEEIEQRLSIIKKLKRKYGQDIEQILNYLAEITDELNNATQSEDQLEKLEAQCRLLEESLWQQADKISQQRHQMAHQLSNEIMQELKDLYLENTQFEVRFFKEKHQLQFQGIDQVEFYLTTNPGEPLKPLVKVASGGELSRILLALKAIFSKAQQMTSIIFDEVDTGVSGRVAQAIAEKILKISRQSQVLCITHLPQVAAAATNQYFIQKTVKNGRTTTLVQPLNQQERIQEVARMLAGVEITPLTLEHAKELMASLQAK